MTINNNSRTIYILRRIQKVIERDFALFNVQSAQTKAMLSVNRELIALYWDIGRQIVQRQEREGWGKSVIDRLAEDIQKAFPGIRGFSAVILGECVRFFSLISV